MQKDIGIYTGPGVGYDHTVKGRWKKLHRNINVIDIAHTDFNELHLLKFKVIVLPGGSGSGICNGLGPDGKAALTNWVWNGGTLIGVCAGMYAMVKGYDWSLGLFDYYVTDPTHWSRGNHQVIISMNADGRKFFKTRKDIIENVNYHNGPIIAKIDDKDIQITNECVLATFKTECHNGEGYDNLMIDSPAIIKANYGKGLVIGISPHFEADKEHKVFISKLILKIL